MGDYSGQANIKVEPEVYVTAGLIGSNIKLISSPFFVLADIILFVFQSGIF